MEGKMPRQKGTYNNESKALQNEFIEWHILDKHTKIVNNLPVNIAKWAKAKSITDRTVRNWMANPEFVERIENRRVELSLALPGATAGAMTSIAVLKANKDDDKSDYEKIKAALVERALAGDRTSAEIYFKTYGVTYVEEEKASRKADFRDQDITQLYARVLALVPTEVIQAEIANRVEEVNE